MKSAFDAMAGSGIKIASLEFDTIGYFPRSTEGLKLTADVRSIEVGEKTKDTPLNKSRVGFVRSPF